MKLWIDDVRPAPEGCDLDFDFFEKCGRNP